MDIVIINKNKPHVLVLLILLIASSVAEKTSVVEGRTLSLKPLQEYSKNLASLGVVCKCCDGDGGDCRSTWTESCSNLQCSSWKSHFIIS
ncbi:uncharacterized protein HKW66_Vig0201590 [Vigna angularis]|uniref:Carboxypeptidase A inhibitor-like domain-containing protein n=2 Tax=Phaseolus angularis TaxID=3914 RepID=A0A8T0JUD0_PHAAN|nr:uncharacterized protein HKW66_Vig0201590 [Vigna angularis]BAT97309.1 hypothetical protein VIGAN_09071000 [Vigna angularis var. angularis]